PPLAFFHDEIGASDWPRGLEHVLKVRIAETAENRAKLLEKPISVRCPFRLLCIQVFTRHNDEDEKTYDQTGFHHRKETHYILLLPGYIFTVGQNRICDSAV